jgi:hypothetical protein
MISTNFEEEEFVMAAKRLKSNKSAVSRLNYKNIIQQTRQDF